MHFLGSVSLISNDQLITLSSALNVCKISRIVTSDSEGPS